MQCFHLDWANHPIWIAQSKLIGCPIEFKFRSTIILFWGGGGGVRVGVVFFLFRYKIHQRHQLISAKPVLTIFLISYIHFETQLLRSGNCQTAGFPEQSLIAVPYKQKITWQNKYLTISEIERQWTSDTKAFCIDLPLPMPHIAIAIISRLVR